MATGLSSFTDALAFGALNDVLSMFHDSNAFGRPNLFEVQIHLPARLGGGFAGRDLSGHNVRDISLKAESLILPGRGLTTQAKSGDQIYGPVREYVREVTYAEDISMTFQSTAGLDDRRFFEAWQERAFNVNTFDASYYYDYVGTLDIYLLDRDNRKTYGLRCKECFPKTIAGMNLSAGPSSEITKTTVAWSFRDWEGLGKEAEASFSERLANKLFDTAVGTVERSITANIPAVVRKLF